MFLIYSALLGLASECLLYSDFWCLPSTSEYFEWSVAECLACSDFVLVGLPSLDCIFASLGLGGSFGSGVALVSSVFCFLSWEGLCSAYKVGVCRLLELCFVSLVYLRSRFEGLLSTLADLVSEPVDFR